MPLGPCLEDVAAVERARFARDASGPAHVRGLAGELQAVRSEDLASDQQLREFVAAEAELAGSCAPLLAEPIDADAVVLAAPGVERRDRRGAVRALAPLAHPVE